MAQRYDFYATSNMRFLLQKNYEKIKDYQFIALPIVIYDTIAYTTQINEQDIFFETILKLIRKQTRTVEEISQKLLLHTELVKVILAKMIALDYINNNYTITRTGEDFVEKNSLHNNMTTKNIYIVKDINQGRVHELPFLKEDLHYLGNEGVFDGSVNIKVGTEGYRKNRRISILDLEKKINQIDKNYLYRNLSSIFSKDIITLDVNNLNPKKSYMIAAIRLNEYVSTWEFINPFTANPCNSTKNFYLSSNSSRFQMLIDNWVAELREKIDDNVATSNKDKAIQLFGSSIQAYSVIHSKVNELLRLYTDLEKMKNENLAGQHMTDTYKTLLYEIYVFYELLLYDVFKRDQMSNSGILDKLTKNGVSDTLIRNALRLGFNKKSEFRLLKNVNIRHLSDQMTSEVKDMKRLLILNLLHSTNMNNHILGEVASRNPYFIDDLYEYKRQYRDKIKHNDIPDYRANIHKVLTMALFICAKAYELEMNELTKVLDKGNSKNLKYESLLYKLKVESDLSLNVRTSRFAKDYLSLIKAKEEKKHQYVALNGFYESLVRTLNDYHLKSKGGFELHFSNNEMGTVIERLRKRGYIFDEGHLLSDIPNDKVIKYDSNLSNKLALNSSILILLKIVDSNDNFITNKHVKDFKYLFYDLFYLKINILHDPGELETDIYRVEEEIQRVYQLLLSMDRYGII